MSVEDPFLAKLKEEAAAAVGRDQCAAAQDRQTTVEGERRATAELERKRPTPAPAASRDRRALAFWQSPVAVALIHKRISGDPQTRPARYFAALADNGRKDGSALSLRAGSPELECELLREGACGSLTFVDASADQLDYARARIPENLSGAVDFVQADPAEHEPPAPVDLVVCNSVLHRFPDPDLLVERFGGWLSPRGMVYVDEFVGPSRFQWSDEQIEIVNRLLACLPDQLRLDLSGASRETKTAISRPDEERFAREHPSEAVAGDRIPAALDTHLEPVAVKPYGGAIFHQFFARIMGNFVRRQEIVKLIMELDAILTERGVLESDYLWAAYRKPA